MLPFKHPSITPKTRGLYLRDWRGTQIQPEHERALHVDAWEPVSAPQDICYPGVWYVFPNINDASEQSLPWREPTHYELQVWFWKHPEARQWLEEREAA
jgi:hypothetical protein